MFQKVKAFFQKFGFFSKRKTTRETLNSLLQKAPLREKDALDGEERLMLSNVLDLRDQTVEDIMVPRVDIIAIPLTISYQNLTAVMAEHPYTRYPVYGENLDDIKGMIHVKDIYQFMQGKNFSCKSIMQKVLFVPQSLEIPDLLMQMRATKISMAVVVDEFGGVDGLATPWDIARKILGDMPDTDMPEGAPQLTDLEDGSYEADARLSIEDFEEAFGKVLTKEDEEEDIDTLGGLIVALAGRVPDRKEVISHASGLEFEILDANPRHIAKVRIRRSPEPETKSPKDEESGGNIE